MNSMIILGLFECLYIYFHLLVAELDYTMKVTDKCDVYSFGVLILQVIISSLASSMEKSIEL